MKQNECDPEPFEGRAEPARCGSLLFNLLLFSFTAVGLGACALTEKVDESRHQQHDKSKSDIRAISAALSHYSINNGGPYPDDLEVLVMPDENGHTYLKQRSLPLDSWGRSYGYEAPQPGQPEPHVFTLGKDGVAGGAGEDADLDNWMLLGID